MPKRIALDTGVVRELCHTEPTWFSVLTKIAASGWSFHLTDICIAELIAARERHSITDEQWAVGVARLDQLLGQFFPCLPGKRDLFHLCGFIDEQDPNKERRTQAFQVEYSRAVWKRLKQPMLPQGSGPEVTFSVDGRTFKCPIRAGQAAAVIEIERDNWVAEMTRAAEPAFNYTEAVKKFKADFDTWAKTDGLPMSIRGDILAHAQAEWERRIASGYDPSSSKRKNDGIDFLLQYAFLWPAILITTDQKLRNFLRMLPSFQAGWTYLPKELAQAFESGILAEPNWPGEAATP